MLGGKDLFWGNTVILQCRSHFQSFPQPLLKAWYGVTPTLYANISFKLSAKQHVINIYF